MVMEYAFVNEPSVRPDTFRKAMDAFPRPICITDLDGHLLYVNEEYNRAIASNTPHTRHQLDPLFDHRYMPEAYLKRIKRSLKKEHRWMFDHSVNTPNGERWETVSISEIADDRHQAGYYLIQRDDFTERRRLQLEADFRARNDGLTHLPNRSCAIEHLHTIIQTLDPQEHLQVTIIDIENFRTINEVYGHAFADELLRSIAKRLKSELDDTVFVSRFGSNEFLCFRRFSPTDKTNELHFIKFIKACFARPFHTQDTFTKLHFNLGNVTTTKHESLDCAALLRRADSALFEAKQSALSSYCFFDEALGEAVHRRHSIAIELRRAIERNELSLVYQPIVNSTTREIDYVEALVRWHSKKLGPVSPGEFVPIAEKSGAILQLGDWILNQAIADLKELKHWHPGLGISINISPAQLAFENRLLHKLKCLLDTMNILPEDIMLEVTEHVFLEHGGPNVHALEELKRAGFATAIDDFGTGYSSLSYLTEFDFDKIKIDRLFVSRLSNSERSRHVTDAIVALAHRLGKKIVAEGVETYQQLELLTNMRCHYFQGYLLFKPLEKSALKTILNEHV